MLLDIRPPGRAGGCDLFDDSFDFAKPVDLPWGRQEFFTVDPDDRKLRIYEISTALASEGKMTATCTRN